MNTEELAEIAVVIAEVVPPPFATAIYPGLQVRVVMIVYAVPVIPQRSALLNP